MNKKILKKVWFVISDKGETIHNTRQEALAAAKKINERYLNNNNLVCSRYINLKGLLY